MDGLTLLKQLIAIRSYSGEEKKLAMFIAGWFRKRKIKANFQRDNLIVFLPGNNSKKAFIFNSHMDTVSAGDRSLWKFDPLVPTMVKNKLVGLGASDMKSGLAAAMLTCEAFSKAKPEVDLWFTYVVREEQDGSGTNNFAKWFQERGYHKKYEQIGAIFTEPTGLSEVEHGHRGNLFLVATATGDSGHASRPGDIKIHAVKKMLEFAHVLEEEMKRWQKEYKSEIFDPPTVGVFTSIEAGVRGCGEIVVVESVNKFPSSCRATFDVRSVPGFHEEAFSKIASLGKKQGVKVELLFPAAPSGFTKADDKLITVIKKTVGKVKLTVSQGSADMGFLSELGVKAIIFGPGEKQQCHVVNESCYPDQVEKAAGIYQKVVSDWAV